MPKSRDNLIILTDKNGIDQNETYNILNCQYNKKRRNYEIIFRSDSDKIYYYRPERVDITQKGKVLAPEDYKISKVGGEFTFFNIKSILKYEGRKDVYYLIEYKSNKGNDIRFYKGSELYITQSSLANPTSKRVFNYLKDIAQLNSLKNPETEEQILAKRYANMSFLSPETALSLYINPSKLRERRGFNGQLIFPFGCNRSQYEATKNAFENQISVIQGPPGTGKTQTILNILANILLQGKTALVVSNNNAAIENVYEKLSDSRYQLSFLSAYLGNSDNKEKFIKQQQDFYPDLKLVKTVDRESFSKIFKNIDVIFRLQEQIAGLRQELSDLDLEYQHFEDYFKGQKVEPLTLHLKSSRKILSLWQDCEAIHKSYTKTNLFFKIKSFFKYGILDWAFYQQDIADLTVNFQNLFYKLKKEELLKKLEEKQAKMISVDGEGHLVRLADESMILLKSVLSQRYPASSKRQHYEVDDLWKNSQQFLKDYPIVLSTTFSSKTSLGGDVIYDYLIMDEASQVDIATGALALSCAKNVVVVGDVHQLSHIVKTGDRKQSEQVFQKYNLSEGYRFTNSFLQSILDVLQDCPQTLLREHYRCHPKIINFCNQKFYDGELIVMTEDQGEENVLRAIRTPKGNHARAHYSQREIDIIKKDIQLNYPINENNTAVITPYRNHANQLNEQIEELDSDTVHKFQGREKDAVILSTVDNVITRFTDNPNLMNVAVSRAKKNLFLVMTGNEQSPDKNISDLLGYIDYHNFEHRESPIYSIFDYLYKQYEQERERFFKKRQKISRYDSENLMWELLNEILKKDGYDSIEIIHTYPVRQIIKEKSWLSEDEKIYISQPNTHVDFALYNHVTKQIVLAVEVDGYKYHKKGSKQFKRDRKKDAIFEKYKIPLVRFKTNGSQEEERLHKVLKEILSSEQGIRE